MDDLGHEVTGSDPDEITGQYHAVGVSKESLGAVLWRNTWGSDGCFEAHATQPRATLIDCSKGSFRMVDGVAIKSFIGETGGLTRAFAEEGEILAADLGTADDLDFLN